MRIMKKAPDPIINEIEKAQEVVNIKTGTKKEGELQDTEEKKFHVFETFPAYVRSSMSATLNMGNYNSLKIEVSISKPCYTEQIDATFDEVSAKVAVLLDQEVDKHTHTK